MFRTPNTVVAVAAALLLAGCGAGAVDANDATPTADAAGNLSAVDSAAVLALVNYPGTTEDVLDHAVGLDSRAAQGIIVARNGADGVSPSSDDVLFASVAAVDAVPYVGAASLTKLAAYAAAHPAPAAEAVEGVAFAGWQSQAVVSGVNGAALADLDAILDSRAAKALFDHRPYTSVAAMGPQSYVGATALKALLNQAPAWWSAMHDIAPSMGGTFDGVAFDDASARIALDIANQATTGQLTGHGLSTSIALTLTSNRPFASVAAVAAQRGIGPATMQALLNYAKSGTWISPVTGFTLDATSIAAETDLLKEQLAEDEGFVEDVQELANHDSQESMLIMSALTAQIDKLAAPLAGQVFADQASADSAIDTAAAVKPLVRAGGWTYLTSIGVAQPATCTGNFQAAVTPELPSVLFLSESDREITVVAFPGAGASAPTAASVMALVGAPAGSTALLRSVDDYYADLEPSSSTADANAPAAIQEAFGQLTDVVYVAVFPPADSDNTSLVQVFLVGRTSCGDLVGLTSISVET